MTIISPQKKIAVLGSTGSIGTQTLDIVRRLPERLKIVALAAGSRADIISTQASEFGVKTVALTNEAAAHSVADKLPDDVNCLSGFDSLETIATLPAVDIVVVAVDGAVGIKATVAALLAGKTVALATKEVLVAAGQIVKNAESRGGGRLVPIDSEHSAVFQCMVGSRSESVSRIWLTASGGPFRTWTSERLASATIEDALNHPTWRMGKKITVDSATMMNKGLEMIEAKWLFDLSIDQVKVVIHPQSIVHSMVQFVDGSILAQLGCADMRLPIEYALLYPERVDAGIPHLDVLSLSRLDFELPDEIRFPCLRLAREAATLGGTATAVLNAANEAAVARFLSGCLSFSDIPTVVELSLEYHTTIGSPSLDQILAADEWARRFVSEVAVP